MENKTRRAVVMVSDVFPPLLRQWFELFKIWENKVDIVYILLGSEGGMSGPKLADSVNEMLSHPKINVIVKESIGVGDRWKWGIQHADADYIMVTHDDVFIYDPQVIDEYFGLVEDNNIVLPLHASVSPLEPLGVFLRNVYPALPWKVEETGEEGCSIGIFYLLFALKETLMKTNLNFGNFNAKKGEYSDELGTAPPLNIGGDVGFALGIDILNKGIKIRPVPNCHISGVPHMDGSLVEDMQKWKSKSFRNWMHVMAMATVLPGWFWSIEEYHSQDIHRIETHYSGLRDDTYTRKYVTLKIAMLSDFLSYNYPAGLSEYIEYMKNEVDFIIEYLNLSKEEISLCREILRSLHKKEAVL